MNYYRKSNPERWIIKGIPILFLIGSFMHFMYDLCGQNPVVGAVAAVNESVWEHTKMVMLPVILWYVIYYLVKKKRYRLNVNRWFTAGLTSLLVSFFTIPCLFYFYTEAWGVELLWVDVLILLVSNILGQLIGLHIYRHTKGIPAWIVSIIFIAIIVIFVIMTFYPPSIPMFRDSVTSTYGI